MWTLITLFCTWCSIQAALSVPRQTFCGNGDHFLTDNYDVITSHAGFAYNHSYGRNLDCMWKIQAPVGMKVELVARSFDLEDDSTCAHDYLILYDGMDTNSTSFGKFCGRYFKPIISSGRYMTLRFITDNSNQAGGFSIFYNFTTSNYVHGTCGANQFQCASGKCIPSAYRCDNADDCSDDSDEHNCAGFTPPTCTANQFDCHNPQGCIPIHWACDGDDDCGNNLDENQATCLSIPTNIGKCGAMIRSGNTGTLTSLNYPNVYSSGMRCLYRIQAPKGTYNLKIKFDEDYSLEGTPPNSCRDYVVLYSDGKTNKQGPFCGSAAPAQFTMPGDHVFVEFVSSYSGTRTGFRLDWKASI